MINSFSWTQLKVEVHPAALSRLRLPQRDDNDTNSLNKEVALTAALAESNLAAGTRKQHTNKRNCGCVNTACGTATLQLHMYFHSIFIYIFFSFFSVWVGFVETLVD